MNSQANRQPIFHPLSATLAGWSDHGHGSLAQRLAYGLRRSIEAGILPAGSVLPPERRLADDLAVSRSTVTSALDLLRGEGLVVSRQGQGTTVAGAPTGAVTSNRMADHLVVGGGGIDLAAGNPADVSHLPPVSIDVGGLLASGAGTGFHPLGMPVLRQALAERHRGLGVHTEGEEIHVTAGAHQAIALVVGALAGRGDTVALESPGYPGIFDILEGLGARTAVLASDRSGITPESLTRVLAEHRPKVVYVQSGPQNPTGTVTTPARLRALAAVFDRHDATVVEDGTLADLAYAGRSTTDLARLCRRAQVVSVGSFSKVLWSGLRIGWLRAPTPLIDRTLHRRLGVDLGPAVPSQLLCLSLLPSVEEIAVRRRASLSANAERAVELLAAELPEWHVVAPAGGSVLWVETPLADTGPLVQFARRHGVHVASGSIAVAGQAPDAHLRICFDRPWGLVDVGLRRLAMAWRELSKRPARVAG